MRRRHIDGQLALYETARRFFANEAVPHLGEWEVAGAVDKALFRKAGELGLLGLLVPEEFGGGGATSFGFNAIVSEASVHAGFMNVGLRLHADIAIPYYVRYGTAQQRQQWLPDLAAGTVVAALAMSEPGAGSDLAGIRTTAVRSGESYILNGSKTFITNGTIADLYIVAARTSQHGNRREGLTLFVVPAGTPGFSRSRPARKLGLRYSDTADLFFDDVEVPATHVLGDPGQAFAILTSNLAQERLSISVGAVAMARAALEHSVRFVTDRRVFNKPLASFQNTKFVLAEASTDVEVGEQLLDRAVSELDQDTLTAADAARVKLFCTEMQGRVVDKCLQLFGGYGYLRDFPLADMYADARVTRVYGGTSEVMKMVIARSLGIDQVGVTTAGEPGNGEVETVSMEQKWR